MASRPQGTDPGPRSEGGGRSGGGLAPAVVDLGAAGAADARLTGAKAAALARATAIGLPVLPGFVVTTAATAAIDRAGGLAGGGEGVDPDVRAAWTRLTDDGRRPLVVRSSSTVEDLAGSSMAGRFESVVGVSGWDEFVAAVAKVIGSRSTAAEGRPGLGPDDPIAVLVQPLLDAVTGGVLFGIDPVTGRTDRIVVATVAGGPAALVSGEVDGDRYELDLDGHVVRHTAGDRGAALRSRPRHALVALAGRLAEVFGHPQDVEWAIDGDDTLWLLQSRPVTTPVAGVPQGPVLGPGPVAETFPEPLSLLEQTMWVPPLRKAVRTVFDLAGTAPAPQLDASPLVTTVDGWVVVDLELFGEVAANRGRRAAIDPRPRVRRLRASWRVGRLRAALPDLAGDLLARADAELAAVPPLDGLTDRQLLALIERTGEALVAVHGHEMLLGLLLEDATPRYTGASVALRVLVHARAEGLDESVIAARYPVVLALSAPRVAPVPRLPSTEDAPPWTPPPVGDRAALLREALRLRVRWFQELGGRAAWALGERLAAAGQLTVAGDVRRLRLDGLRAMAAGRAEPWEVAGPDAEPAVLPVRFRLTGHGRPVPEGGAGAAGGGSGAGGGRGRGPVAADPRSPAQGSVLVVRTLDPSIAPVLPRLAGLVAETGSVLSHVAILAREAGVPTVVGSRGAVERFEPGTVVIVDGVSGEVRDDGEDR